VVEELRIVRAAALRLIQGEVLRKPILDSWNQVLDGGFKIELQQPVICGDNPVLSVRRQG